MSNMLLIAKREYLERVRSKAFLFMTLFIPALMFGVTVLPTLLAARMSGGTKHLVIAASDRRTAEMIRERLQKQPRISPANNSLERNKPIGSKYEVDLETNASDAQRASLADEVKTKKLDGVIWATDEAIAANKVTFITRDVSNLMDREILTERVSQAVTRRALEKKGLDATDIEAALKPVDMETVNPAGTGAGNPLNTFLAVLAMVMVMYVSVVLYGVNVMRAVLEEKTSRIMEVMLSTATPKEMMLGKILGVGAVGLTQIGIWSLTAIVLPTAGMVAAGGLKGVISLRVAIFFPIFFLLGYTLYSSMYAALGAMANSEQETQQLQFIVVMPLILSVIVLVQILQNPSTPLSLWGSLFPLTAPLIMFTRIALDGTVPWWQIAISISLMVGTIYGLIVLCGRIYRIGILMYGKKPTLPEIVKWLKYA